MKFILVFINQCFQQVTLFIITLLTFSLHHLKSLILRIIYDTFFELVRFSIISWNFFAFLASPVFQMEESTRINSNISQTFNFCVCCISFGYVYYLIQLDLNYNLKKKNKKKHELKITLNSGKIQRNLKAISLCYKN